MDYVALLKRAFHITIKYRALWLFGILLAIFGGRGGRFGNYGGGSGAESDFSGGNAPIHNPFAGMDPAVLITVMLAVVLLVLFLVAVAVVIRSVSRAALIGMVAKIEDGETVTVKSGWRIGWSGRAWRIFLINVLVGVPLAILAIITLLFAASPLVLMVVDNSLTAPAIVMTVLFIIIWALIFFAISVVISPIMELSWRYTVLHETGATESLRLALTLARQRLKDVVISVLVMFGVGIATVAVMFVALILLLLFGVLGGGIPALAGYLITQEPMVALLAGLPIFLLIVVVPMIFLGGLAAVFQSTMWTLIFNELTAEPATDAPESTIEPAAEPSPETEQDSAPDDDISPAA